MAYLYPISLAVISVFVMGLERLRPWRKDQQQLRTWFGSDLLHLVFNGHFLGVLVFMAYERFVHPPLLAGLDALHVDLHANVAADWPIGLQIVVALFAIDLAQWCVHNILHRVPVLWEFHKVHHSVKDGEMDWIVSFRFHWMEVVIYKSFLYVPLAFFGFGLPAIMFHAIFGTLIGHLNHANLDWDYGPLKYLLNNPRMHLWHHDYDGDERTTVNFGIIFSCWDYLFGTAKVPARPPAHIGYAGVDRMPQSFFWHALYPFVSNETSRTTRQAVVIVLVLFGGLSTLAAAPRLMRQAASQPAVVSVEEAIHPPAVASVALERLGEDARERGYARPEFMASALEVTRALGAPTLVLLDVRPSDRFEAGHIPTARNLDRPHYSVKEPVPGLSRTPEELQQLLRSLGVDDGDEVVLYGDGGPEPYRLWWTLAHVGGLWVRVLDGGLPAYKELGRPTERGPASSVKPGHVHLPGADTPLLWSGLESRVRDERDVVWLDARTQEECTGQVQKSSAARAGRIPGSLHLPWSQVLRDPPVDQRLMARADLEAQFERLGLGSDRFIVTYCQSGTRSSASWFALLQAGYSEDRMINYDGSWAEYSRLSTLPAETGPLAVRP